MDPRLQQIVNRMRRRNPPADDASAELQEQIVNAGLKQALDEDDLDEAAELLGIDANELIEQMASWL